MIQNIALKETGQIGNSQKFLKLHFLCIKPHESVYSENKFITELI